MALVLGIDTGGTFTDAVLLDDANHEVLGTAKALTTRGDLAEGVIAAMTKVVAQMPADFNANDVARVCLSTTLATNALVEGHGSNVCAVLIGFDARMAERSRIAHAIPEASVVHIDGGHDHTGHETAPLDEDTLEALARSARVSAFSVTANYASRNPAHELRAKELLEAWTGAHVTASSELTDALNGPRRALTATYNARIIGLIHSLIDAVRGAMASLDLNAPIMVVKGDGAIASADSVMRRPIQTILSGPAASVIGARFLSGLTDFVVSDIGGTTTDIATVKDGWPELNPAGASVGGFRTLVDAVDMATVGLGGDSAVGMGPGGTVKLEDQRVVPLALLADRFPEVGRALKTALNQTSAMLSATQYLMRPHGGTGTSSATLSDEDLRFLGALPAQEPRRYNELVLRAADRSRVARLLKQGALQISGFTPSDAAHVLGWQTHWDADAARAACELVARAAGVIDLKQPLEPQVKGFALSVCDAVADKSTRVILNKLLGIEAAPDDRILDAAATGNTHIGFVDVKLTPSLPLVAVGGPAAAFYASVGDRLNVTPVIPEHYAVANAVGAAAGLVRTRASIELTYREGGGYLLHADTGPRNFNDPGEALATAKQLAHEQAQSEAQRMGATGLRTTCDVQRVDIPNMPRDRSLISATIVAECVGISARSGTGPG